MKKSHHSLATSNRPKLKFTNSDVLQFMCNFNNPATKDIQFKGLCDQAGGVAKYRLFPMVEYPNGASLPCARRRLLSMWRRIKGGKR